MSRKEESTDVTHDEGTSKTEVGNERDAPRLWRISRHTNARLTNAEADSILAEGMRILRDIDGSGDVRCPLDIRRDGNVGTFSVGNGIINTTADWLAVCNTGGRVHVVNQINICGGQPGSSIIGCSSFNGDCMVVVRTDADIEAILWMHEYGHNQGLPDFYVDGWVMDGIISSNDRKVDQSDCSHYQSPERFFAVVSEPRFPTPRAKNVRDFVHQVFIHGVPHERASEFSSGDVPALLEMLADMSEERYWTNIVVTLCIIGDRQALEPLINFLTSGSGTLTRYEYDAKSAVIMNLGHLLKGGKIREARAAFDFLKEGLEPGVWGKRINWTNPYGLTPEQQNEQLAKLAIWGLAISGEAESGEALRALQSSTRSAELNAVLNEAIAYYQKTVSAPTKPGVSGTPTLESLSGAAERALDKVLTKVTQDGGRLGTGAGDKRLFFPDGIELIDVEFGFGIDTSKPNVSVKVHVRGPNAKPGISSPDPTDSEA
jgi:hypothetical protein